ncbi:MAG: hypothetical protein AAB785_01935, partial [Patescibacteria group bacterium]
MNFLSAKAVRTQNYLADVYFLDCPAVFIPMSWGYNLSQHRFLNFFLKLTDYLPLFCFALLKYDIFEFCFRGGFLMNSYLQKIEPQLLKICAKKVVIYGYGSDCKILSEVKKQGRFNNAMDRSGKDENIDDEIVCRNLLRAKKYADVLIAGGDLIHFGPKGIMLPLAADLAPWKVLPTNHKKVLTIVHATNHRTHKGSRFIISAVEKLMTKKLPIKFLLIEGKSFRECQRLYQEGDIFITDVITGWHGLTAIEAMALGRPVISYIRKDIWDFHKYYARDIPLISANPINLKQQIIRLVNDFTLRRQLGQKGAVYARKYHSLEFVGKLRVLIYEHLWRGKKINQRIFEREAKRRKL